MPVLGQDANVGHSHPPDHLSHTWCHLDKVCGGASEKLVEAREQGLPELDDILLLNHFCHGHSGSDSGPALPWSLRHVILQNVNNGTLIIDDLDNFLFNRSDEKFEINGQKFHFHKILSGTTKANAEKICQERGTFLFEPRDATINNEVYQQMHKLTNYGYWLNIERNDTEHE